MTYYLYRFDKNKKEVYQCYFEAPNRMDAERQARDVVGELESKIGPTVVFVLLARDSRSKVTSQLTMVEYAQ